MARKKNTSSPMPAMAFPKEPPTHSVSVRKISNGYVARHSVSGGGQYKEREVYHPTMPPVVAAMAAPPKVAPPKAPTKAPAKAVLPMKAGKKGK